MSKPNVRIKWNGPRISSRAEDAARKALWLAAEEILNHANSQVPLDTGILKASGETHVDGMGAPDNGPLSGTSKRTGKRKTVERPPLRTVSGEGLMASIFYNTPYAEHLHESSGYDFQGDRADHWLEDAFEAKGPRALQWARDEFKRRGF